MIRGSAASDVITPGEPPLTFALGRPNATVLVRLNASARNCSLIRSVIVKLREIETSRSCKAGPRSVLRPEFPKTPGAGKLNALLPVIPLQPGLAES